MPAPLPSDAASAPSTGAEPSRDAPEPSRDAPEPSRDAPETTRMARRAARHRGRNLVRAAGRQAAELPMLILVAFLIAVVIKTFLVQAFYIPSGSMLPTLHVGDRVLVEKISYLLKDPARGDVVVFERDVFGKAPDVPWVQDARNFLRELLGLPTGQAEDYIKRIVAVAGDRIRYVGTPRRLLVNGEEVDISYVRGGRDRFSGTITNADCEGLGMEATDQGCRVPAGRVFVMGDNRGDSEDSRILGPIDDSKIVGRAFVIIWPPGDMGTL